jgi:hypothetical protein
MCGICARHGLHHVAQNSINTARNLAGRKDRSAPSVERVVEDLRRRLPRRDLRGSGATAECEQQCLREPHRPSVSQSTRSLDGRERVRAGTTGQKRSVHSEGAIGVPVRQRCGCVREPAGATRQPRFRCDGARAAHGRARRVFRGGLLERRPTTDNPYEIHTEFMMDSITVKLKQTLANVLRRVGMGRGVPFCDTVARRGSVRRANRAARRHGVGSRRRASPVRPPPVKGAYLTVPRRRGGEGRESPASTSTSAYLCLLGRRVQRPGVALAGTRLFSSVLLVPRVPTRLVRLARASQPAPPHGSTTCWLCPSGCRRLRAEGPESRPLSRSVTASDQHAAQS